MKTKKTVKKVQRRQCNDCQELRNDCVWEEDQVPV